MTGEAGTTSPFRGKRVVVACDLRRKGGPGGRRQTLQLLKNVDEGRSTEKRSRSIDGGQKNKFFLTKMNRSEKEGKLHTVVGARTSSAVSWARRPLPYNQHACIYCKWESSAAICGFPWRRPREHF